ncbi:MAG TPA: neutral zinc metallopeptidase [Pirellulales bacterium]
MRLDEQRTSDNVEDRRGSSGPMMVGGGVGSVVLVLLAMFFGVDPNIVIQNLPQGQPQQQGPPPDDEESNKMKEFVGKVLASTEDVWAAELPRQKNTQYQPPRLVMFSNSVESACGNASSAVGPFYCPLDAKVYIDLSFYDELRDRFHAPGDFAEAYVIAHEIGHHVQNLLGISDKVHQMQQAASSKEEANELSVKLELQADFFAGVWAHYAAKRGLIEPGDIEEGLTAASAIGDDKLQKQSQGYVVPDSFTHGSSEQRVRWFRKGFETGDTKQGDTFSASSL